MQEGLTGGWALELFEPPLQGPPAAFAFAAIGYSPGVLQLRHAARALIEQTDLPLADIAKKPVDVIWGMTQTLPADNAANPPPNLGRLSPN